MLVEQKLQSCRDGLGLNGANYTTSLCISQRLCVFSIQAVRLSNVWFENSPACSPCQNRPRCHPAVWVHLEAAITMQPASAYLLMSPSMQRLALWLTIVSECFEAITMEIQWIKTSPSLPLSSSAFYSHCFSPDSSAAGKSHSLFADLTAPPSRPLFPSLFSSSLILFQILFGDSVRFYCLLTCLSVLACVCVCFCAHVFDAAVLITKADTVSAPCRDREPSLRLLPAYCMCVFILKRHLVVPSVLLALIPISLSLSLSVCLFSLEKQSIGSWLIDVLWGPHSVY